MRFVSLRLAGFKSFVEPTELNIETGLTGIVGPNGCGKSNLVEALRWVMGETRVKQMRGGEMDDVIFAGTDTRPARNVAEVCLAIDNRERKAPAPFNDTDAMEIVRRIERGTGSSYRVQGRDVRMRDVQLLFADAATGAHSPSLVSQGKIGEIINAKPTARRALLEEAAGISGLHSRRHEAELKLRAAEQNLARVDDVLTTLDTQHQSLKKQARQAARYRNLSHLIRRAEAIVLHWRWQDVERTLAEADQRLKAATDLVTERTEEAARAAAALAEGQAGLPDLRTAEREAASEVARLTQARETLDAEERRVRSALSELAARLQQIAGDEPRETALREDARAALARLEAEIAEITAAGESAAETARETEAALSVAQTEMEAQEREVARLTEAVAAAEAQRAALRREITESEARTARLSQRLAEVERDRAAAAAEAVGEADMAAAEARQTFAEDALRQARLEAEAAVQARRAAEAELDGARRELRAAEGELSRISAEAQGLRQVLAQGRGDGAQPVIDRTNVQPGYEAALGAALGEDLSGSVEDGAAASWRLRPGLDYGPDLPPGVEPLSRFVEAPPELARRLGQIGVVPEGADGDMLAGMLWQGQRLVDRAGQLWRWDGYGVRAGAPSAAAVRLGLRNRLTTLEAQVAASGEKVQAARGRVETLDQAAREAARRVDTAQTGVNTANAESNAARDARAALMRKAEAVAGRLKTLGEQAERVAADLTQDANRRRAAEERLSEIPDPAATRARLDGIRAGLAETRSRFISLKTEHERLVREAEARKRRSGEIARETAAWQTRNESAGKQIEVLAERRTAAVAEQERLAARPAEIEAERATIADTARAAEATRQAAADALAAAEAAVRAADQSLKAADAALGAAREDRVRAEAALDSAHEHHDATTTLIRERLDCAPDGVLAAGEIEPGETLPELAQAQGRFDRLVKERDTMGPVNLRAEEEAAELEQQIAGMQAEKADLVAAIAKLRQGIGALNREGRDRLVTAFQAVNTHFESLFGRLFGGGKAHLALVDSEDPLEAGLEVMASPPGKKLQSLSLLSGGEQTLTALSLLFAVFLTNPAPICVLDEVDAPLDDANVDRFCILLDEIARETGTRFLLVTHHRLTMARMDRLFGVTMTERGISQLVSVDLQEAARIRASA